MKFNRLWANVVHTIQATSSTPNSYDFDVLSKVTGLDNTAKSYPIRVTPTLATPVNGVTLSSCEIKASEDSCINKVSLPKNMFIAGKELLVTFKTNAKDLDDKNAIISSHSVGSTMKEIHNKDELVNAFKDDTSGKLFILENDIALTESWIPVAELKNATFDGQGHKITNLRVNTNSERAGMFSYIGDNVTIKNLNLQGKVTTTGVYSSGLLAGKTSGKSVRILNSNFKSDVTGSLEYVGGVFGSIDGEAVIESVTVTSIVTGINKIGGLAGAADAIVTWKNIRVTSEVNGTERTGGLVGGLYTKDSYIADNIIVDTKINVGSGGSLIGGVFGGTRGLKMSNIDATVNIIGGNATRVGGIVGNFSWEKDKDTLSNAIARGTISTSIDPKVAANRISGIASAGTKAEVNKAIDMTTIAYTNGTAITNYVSPLTATEPAKYVNSGNVYYTLPPAAGVDAYIAAANPAFVAALTGATAADQKAFLTAPAQGFDFTNTWTIKESDNVQTIGIKEDSIPQFPKW